MKHQVAVVGVGFDTGLTIDMFGKHQRMHAAATVLMAFARPRILKLVGSRANGYEVGNQSSPSSWDSNGSSTYVSVSVLLHHVAIFS